VNEVNVKGTAFSRDSLYMYKQGKEPKLLDIYHNTDFILSSTTCRSSMFVVIVISVSV